MPEQRYWIPSLLLLAPLERQDQRFRSFLNRPLSSIESEEEEEEEEEQEEVTWIMQ